MIRYFSLSNGKIRALSTYSAENVAWCDVFLPSENELIEISKYFDISADHLEDCLDETEHPRHTSDVVRKNDLLLIHVVPNHAVDLNQYPFTPFGLFLTSTQKVVTVHGWEPHNYETMIAHLTTTVMENPTFLFFEIVHYLFDLLDQSSQEIARRVRDLQLKILKTQNVRDIQEPFQLNSYLINFNTSIISNAEALRAFYAKDMPAITSNLPLMEKYTDTQTAIDQVEKFSTIIRDVLANSLDAYASVINNNLSSVMKTVGSISLLLMIPTIIASFYGMNVGVPGGTYTEFGQNLSFYIIIGISFLLSFTIWRVFRKKQWL